MGMGVGGGGLEADFEDLKGVADEDSDCGSA